MFGNLGSAVRVQRSGFSGQGSVVGDLGTVGRIQGSAVRSSGTVFSVLGSVGRIQGSVFWDLGTVFWDMGTGCCQLCSGFGFMVSGRWGWLSGKGVLVLSGINFLNNAVCYFIIMELLSIISVVIVIVVFVLVLKLFHSVIKAAFSAILLVLIVGVIFGVIVVNDVNDFQQDFKNSTVTYVLHDGQDVLTGFEATGIDFETFDPVARDQLPQSYENLTGEDMYVFVNESVIQNVTGKHAPGTQITIAELLSSDDETIVSQGFMLSIFTMMAQDGPFVLFEHMRSGELNIHPERISFSLIQFTPRSIWDMAKDTVQVKSQEVVDDIMNSSNTTTNATEA